MRHRLWCPQCGTSRSFGRGEVQTHLSLCPFCDGSVDRQVAAALRGEVWDTGYLISSVPGDSRAIEFLLDCLAVRTFFDGNLFER